MANEFSIIDCREIKDSVRESYDDINGVSASVTLHCAWSNRWALVEDIIVNNRVWPKNSSSAVPPEPRSATIAPFTCQTVIPVDSQEITYAEAAVTINYNNLTIDLVAESLEPYTDSQKLDFRQFRWASAAGEPLIEGQAILRHFYGLTLRRTLYRQSSVPGVFTSGIGGVNNAVYNSPISGLSFGAETLLFQPLSTNKTVSTGGNTGWTISSSFVYKPFGHNKQWNEQAQAYQDVYIANGSRYVPHPLTDLSDLLF